MLVKTQALYPVKLIFLNSLGINKYLVTKTVTFYSNTLNKYNGVNYTKEFKIFKGDCTVKKKLPNNLSVPMEILYRNQNNTLT